MAILADTFRAALRTYLQAHDPTRVLIGGLPDFLLRQIASEWDATYRLLLVANESIVHLPANVTLCKADDLTAERQHTWAALVSADQSRGIQESIRSAGAGTVRQLWSSGFPWTPCNLPDVRWRDIRDQLIARIGLTESRDAVVKCIDRFRDELSGEVDASARFFRALDSFHTGTVTYADVCYELGFPAHEPGKPLRKPRKDRESVLALLDQFVERFKEEGVDEALLQFVDVAKTHYASDAKKSAAVQGALQFFADEFRHLEPADTENPMRAWRTIFRNSRSNWENLGVDELLALIGPSGEKLSLEYSLDSGHGIQIFAIGDNQIIARNQNIAPAKISGTFEFSDNLVQQAHDAAAAGVAWRLFARINRTSLQLASVLPEGTGPHHVDVRLEKEGKQSVRFYIGPDSSSDRVTSRATTLWECCQEYPFIIATSGARIRAGKRKRSRDEDGKLQYEVWQDITLPAQGRVVLHGFICRLAGQLTVVYPGESSQTIVSGLTDIPESLCQRFVLTVDAVEGLDLVFTWPDATGTYNRATISFDFEGDLGPRDDSLTDLLLRAHSGRGNKPLREQLATVKRAERLPPRDLAIKDSVKPIAQWEIHQQNAEVGWWPILVSTSTDLRNQWPPVQAPEQYLFRSHSLDLDEQANAWQYTIESKLIDILPLELSHYVTTRRSVIDALIGQFQLSQEESSELNLARKAMIGLLDQKLLKQYVEAYMSLMAASARPDFSNQWRARSASVDTVVLFGAKTTAPMAYLVGPWHPVSLVRLFFVQHCLSERLLEDDLCSLARILVQTQPIATGTVLNAQLQRDKAIAFPTGDPHWLWLYRQQTQSELPPIALVHWLQHAGLDPIAAPLGVDAEVLPQTLKQYTLAYPSRQTLRVLLDDCSQRTFQVIREELLSDETTQADDDRLKVRLPGGLSVYDSIAQIDRDMDGQPLSYEPDLPLRWHHGLPVAAVPMDVATLPRSHRVDFETSKGRGAHSTSVPIARRGLVDFNATGLQVATAIDTAPVWNDLEGASAALLNAFEPEDQQLSWGTSLTIAGTPKANWTLCSAAQVDPRLFVEYVRNNPGTALWTYRLFSLDNTRTPEFGRGHFLIARVSQSLAAGLQAQLDRTGLTAPAQTVLRELAEAGLTLGDEFLRTGRTAEGALGQYLIQRLLWHPAGSGCVLPHWTVDKSGTLESAGFLLQVDPFNAVLQTLAGRGGSPHLNTDFSHQRSDLVSLHLQICGDQLWIKPVVFESKLVTVGQPDIENASAQALATAELFDHLLEFCLQDSSKGVGEFWAQPERLLLSEILHLGLRLARGSFKGNSAQWHDFERVVLSKILSGHFRRDNAEAVVIVHNTGKSVNNIISAQPHAFVRFSDANAPDSASAVYHEVQEALKHTVRHICGDQTGSSIRGASPAVSVSVAPAEMERPPRETERPTADMPPSPPKPPPAEMEKAIEKKEPPPIAGLEIAHSAFDKAFSDFIGNRAAIEKLRDDLVDALIKHPPHLPSAYLFTGNPSTGKTTLANKIAALLDVTFVKLVGTNIRTEADLVAQVDNAFQASDRKPKITPSGSQGLPEHEYPECLIFIDEIHLVKGHAQEGLLTLTEPKDRYIRLRDRICRFPKATYVAATTRDSDIDRALRTRFGNPIHLNDYKVEEVAEMLRVKSTTWEHWSADIRLALAHLSRCIPREAERLAQKLERKMKVSLEPLTLELAVEKLRLEEGLDRNGLDRVCWDVLRLLAKQSRPLGRETLSNQLGRADEDKIVSEIIPSLQALGLVEQVAGGQKISDRGRNYIRNEAPPT